MDSGTQNSRFLVLQYISNEWCIRGTIPKTRGKPNFLGSRTQNMVPEPNFCYPKPSLRELVYYSNLWIVTFILSLYSYTLQCRGSSVVKYLTFTHFVVQNPPRAIFLFPFPLGIEKKFFSQSCLEFQCSHLYVKIFFVSLIT